VYSYLHIPLVFGIVLAALGLKKTLGHVDEPLALVSATAFCGGVALYFLALSAMRLRCGLRAGRLQLAGALTAVAAIPVAVRVDALAALAILAGVAAVSGFTRVPESATGSTLARAG